MMLLLAVVRRRRRLLLVLLLLILLLLILLLLVLLLLLLLIPTVRRRTLRSILGLRRWRLNGLLRLDRLLSHGRSYNYRDSAIDAKLGDSDRLAMAVRTDRKILRVG